MISICRMWSYDPEFSRRTCSKADKLLQKRKERVMSIFFAPSREPTGGGSRLTRSREAREGE
jgi:hypothetical protein